MPLSRKAQSNWQNFSLPISYKVGEDRPKNRFADAQNVISNQGRLETRNGFSRVNTHRIGPSGEILSMSYFVENDGTRHILAKVGTILYNVTTGGAVTELRTGLTATTKHRGVTLNGRHIIAIENDGLFFYDGTNFSALGQAAPTAPTVAASGSGKKLDASDYRVRLTYYASSIGFETNGGVESAIQTVTSGQQIDITSIPNGATHPLIDKVRVYVRDYANDGDYIFWDELDTGVANNTIDENPFSTQTPRPGMLRRLRGDRSI